MSEETEKIPINGFYIEVGSHVERELYFGASEDFFEDADETFKEYMRDFLYGIYYMVSTMPDEIIGYGAALRSEREFVAFATDYKKDEAAQSSKRHTNNVYPFPAAPRDDDDTVH